MDLEGLKYTDVKKVLTSNGLHELKRGQAPLTMEDFIGDFSSTRHANGWVYKSRIFAFIRKGAYIRILQPRRRDNKLLVNKVKEVQIWVQNMRGFEHMNDMEELTEYLEFIRNK